MVDFDTTGMIRLRAILVLYFSQDVMKL